MRTVSPTALQAMLAQETAEVFLVFLQISHSAFGTLRLVHNTQSVTRADGTYDPYPMRILLPDQRSDQIPEVQIIVDNVDRMVLEKIRTLDGIPSVTMDVALASSPDTLEAGPFNFSLLNVTYDALAITGKLGYEDDLLNQPVPSTIYTPTNSPGLAQ